MIDRLTGTLLDRTPDAVILDLNGIGYRLQTTLETAAALPPIGARTTLFTHLAIREDAWELYGFATADERRHFRLLLGVNGIGPKLALAVLSALPPAELRRALAENDLARLTRVPGIGKKSAQRILLELRDKPDLSQSAPQSPLLHDAALALAALGFSPTEADRLVHQAHTARPEITRPSDLVKAALASRS